MQYFDRRALRVHIQMANKYKIHLIAKEIAKAPSHGLSLQKAAQSTTNVLQIQQESVMTEQREIFAQLNVLDGGVSACAESLGNFALLPGREENVARDAHDEDWMVFERGQAHNEVAWGSFGSGRCY